MSSTPSKCAVHISEVFATRRASVDSPLLVLEFPRSRRRLSAPPTPRTRVQRAEPTRAAVFKLRNAATNSDSGLPERKLVYLGVPCLPPKDRHGSRVHPRVRAGTGTGRDSDPRLTRVPDPCTRGFLHIYYLSLTHHPSSKLEYFHINKFSTTAISTVEKQLRTRFNLYRAHTAEDNQI
ncbi:hypothetical protein C8J57DRAFT_1234776 [Mycena rebaudengoi]|nr:hypothetical protein C8J57DRAFT_1234776 [Mycena rebaudengoi]